MASITTAAPFESVRGSIGGLVFYNRHGKTYARRRVVPANPDTEGQRAVRRAFGDAVRSWQALDADGREKWRRKATRLRASGYNLFISQYMRRNIPPRPSREKIPGIFLLSRKPPPPFPLRFNLIAALILP